MEEKYICGDMNTSLIKTVNGLTIMVQHDVGNPQPYDRINLISGVKGMFRDYPERIYLDGQAGEEAFTGIGSYKEKYGHKLWKEQGAEAEERGHGGMDFMMLYRLVQCMREGLAPDIDVYDAASWSASVALSEKSVAQGSAPVKFPDFTRGQWKSGTDQLRNNGGSRSPSRDDRRCYARNIAIDAYRGFVMLLMMAEVLRFSEVAQIVPGNWFWKVSELQPEPCAWVGCSLHDTIQPSFSFLVGVALPYSIASRIGERQKFRQSAGHMRSGARSF